MNIIYAIFEHILTFRSLFVLFSQKQELGIERHEIKPLGDKLDEISEDFKVGVRKVFAVL